MSKWIDLETDASTGKPYLWKCDECGDPKTSKGKKTLEAEHKRLREMQKVQPHTYRGVTLNDVMMYFDSLAGNEGAWTEFCSCLECRGWGLYHIRSVTDKNVGTTDARQNFMDIVYAELASDPDNNRANRIIWAADEYATDKYVGTKIRREPLELARAIDGLTEWQKHVQADSNIDRDITVAIEALKAQLSTNLAEEYARAVRNWLVNYQVKCADLAGRYTPYEVLGWIVSDWRKENGIW